jgi:hypothetical protein
MNRDLLSKAIVLLVSYREYTGDFRMANLCGEVIEELKAELAKPEMPTKIFGPNLEEILNAAGFYRRDEYTKQENLNVSGQCTHKLDKNIHEPVAWKLQFLTDVVTASGLLAYGKRDKGLAEKISNDAYKWKVELYASPQRKEWVGLTDDEINKLSHHESWLKDLIRAIEAKLKDKNT